MLGGLRPKPDFLDFNLGLRLARLTILLGLLVKKLSKIKHSDYRRFCLWSHFYQIQVSGFGYGSRLIDRHDAFIFTVRVDQADFRHPNSLVYPVVRCADVVHLSKSVRAARRRLASIIPRDGNGGQSGLW